MGGRQERTKGSMREELIRKVRKEEGGEDEVAAQGAVRTIVGMIKSKTTFEYLFSFATKHTSILANLPKLS